MSCFLTQVHTFLFSSNTYLCGFVVHLLQIHMEIAFRNAMRGLTHCISYSLHIFQWLALTPNDSGSISNSKELGLLCQRPGLGRSSGEGKGYPLQYSGLENPVDCIIHGGAKSHTQLSDFHFYKVFFSYVGGIMCVLVPFKNTFL